MTNKISALIVTLALLAVPSAAQVVVTVPQDPAIPPLQASSSSAQSQLAALAKAVADLQAGVADLAARVLKLESAPPPATQKKLILLTQSGLSDTNGAEVRAWPSYIAGKRAHIDTLPFDGIAIHNVVGLDLMNGALHSVATIQAEFAPLKGLVFARAKNNFAVVHVRKPADFFDSWANTVQSFQNLATVLKDVGVQGILFDNEEYTSPTLWAYPGDVNYAATKTLTDYYAQARLRGEEVIKAVQAVYPESQFMFLLSPNENCSTTPSLVREWTPNPNRLTGAFSVGLMMGSNKPVIDGNEVGYAYRSQAEFDAAAGWNKSGMASSGCAFIPSSFASTYPSRVSVSEPVYNQSILYANGNTRVMNLSVFPGVIKMAIQGSESYAWLYWEGANWYNPVASTFGVPQAWFDAVNAAWLAR